MRTIQLLFVQRGIEILIEVPETAQELARGLSWRKTLPETSGMLFDFGPNVAPTLWMRNTFLTLDMLFIDESGKVVGILERVPPQNDVSRTTGQIARYVLEVSGGFAARNGIQIGQHVTF
jgi:uncharacterized protein